MNNEELLKRYVGIADLHAVKLREALKLVALLRPFSESFSKELSWDESKRLINPY